MENLNQQKVKGKSNKSIISLILLLVGVFAIVLMNRSKFTTPTWIITQHRDEANSVMLFYSIEDKEGNLVLVDGGYDANYVKSIIEKHNNHVSAWIITHPHPDHAIAFNEIMSNPEGIVVDNVYTVDVNYNRYKETAQDYDRFDVYENFLAIIQSMNNVTYLKENDELTLLGGLHMTILHAWDEDVEKLNVNLLNNGSMIFKLAGAEESMLFCADVENEMEQIILDRHKEELDVDYVQLGHHGNWGMTTNFYDYLNPKAVFFDVPMSIIEATDTYDARQLNEYFMNRNIEIYYSADAPNQIELK